MNDVSNQTPEWRAVTAELSGYRVIQAPYLNALSAADIIGLAQAILRVHPPVQADSSMQAMARSAEFRAVAAEEEAATARAEVEQLTRALEAVRGEAYAWTPSKAAHALGSIAHEALAARTVTA